MISTRKEEIMTKINMMRKKWKIIRKKNKNKNMNMNKKNLKEWDNKKMNKWME